MHEYAMVEALLANVTREVAHLQGARVTKLHVSVGELSGLDPRLFATAYETFRAVGGFEGVELELRDVPARWVCEVCNEPIPHGTQLHCPSCHVPAKLLTGGEVVLERIELEVQDV